MGTRWGEGRSYSELRREAEEVFVPGPAAAILCQCGSEEEAAATQSGDSAAAAAAAGPDTASLVTRRAFLPRVSIETRESS